MSEFKFPHEFLTKQDLEELIVKLKNNYFEISHKEFYITKLYNSYMTTNKFNGIFVEIKMPVQVHEFIYLIDYFQCICRFRCRRKESPITPFQWIKKRSNIETCCKILEKEDKLISAKNIFEIASKLMCRILCPEFQPVIVKGLFSFLNSAGYKTNRWLDMSAGRGSRLISSLSLVNEYLGFDPDHCLHRNYIKQLEFFNGDFRTHRVVRKEFQEAKLENNYWDIMFSSPPYFDLEIYSNEEEQSIKKNNNLEKWGRDFVYPSLKIIKAAIKPNGLIAVNISNSFVNPDIHYTEIFFEAAASLNLEYLGVIGFSINGPTYPIWIWKKT